jgi:hypothetical protein
MNQIAAHRPGFITDNIIQKLPLAKLENPRERRKPPPNNFINSRTYAHLSEPTRTYPNHRPRELASDRLDWRFVIIHSGNRLADVKEYNSFQRHEAITRPSGAQPVELQTNILSAVIKSPPKSACRLGLILTPA